jgi:starvation-inducible DNA-binding protein
LVSEYGGIAVSNIQADRNGLAAAVRLSIDEAAELEDAGTADLFTEISRGIDKWLWFVEAHSQATK